VAAKGMTAHANNDGRWLPPKKRGTLGGGSGGRFKHRPWNRTMAQMYWPLPARLDLPSILRSRQQGRPPRVKK
jgi:hypothetical protein